MFVDIIKFNNISNFSLLWGTACNIREPTLREICPFHQEFVDDDEASE